MNYVTASEQDLSRLVKVAVIYSCVTVSHVFKTCTLQIKYHRTILASLCQITYDIRWSPNGLQGSICRHWNCMFFSFGCLTRHFRACSQSVNKLICLLNPYNNNKGRNIASVSGDNQEPSFHFQCISVTGHHFNSILLHNSFPSDNDE